MPRGASFKIQGAATKTRWTLAPDNNHSDSSISSQLHRLKSDEAMQANGNGQYYPPHENSFPRYESYDGSQQHHHLQHNSVARSDSGGGGWKLPTNGLANGSYQRNDDFDYDTPLEERASHQISLNTHMRSGKQDSVGQHLLYETAMYDSQAYETLSIADIDALKKELVRLNARVDAANRKLALESKVKDAAQNLQKLYSGSSKGRADTPQSEDGARKNSRSSLLNSRGRPSSNRSSSPGSQTVHQAEDELAMSVRMVDQVNAMLKGLLERRQGVESRLLRHTAAVLADQASKSGQKISGTALSRSRQVEPQPRHEEDEDASSVYSPDEFDGIRDILHGTASNASLKPSNSVQRIQQEHEQHLSAMQARLEQLNEQLRHVIGEASRTRGVTLAPERSLEDSHTDPHTRLDKRFSRLENNLHSLEQEQQDVKVHYARVQDSAYSTRNAIEEQLCGLNERIHNTLLLGSDMQDMESLREPPQASGHGYQNQMHYMDESLAAIDRLLKQQQAELDNARDAHGGASRAVEDAHAKAAAHEVKVDEYETTLGGLWEILQSERQGADSARGLTEEHDAAVSPRESFSLQAFSARVQHLFDRAQSADEQHAILHRQIQQQRELNGKSDAEKDGQMTELKSQHDELTAKHALVHKRLDEATQEHAFVKEELSQSQIELMNLTNELDSHKRALDGHEKAEEDRGRQLVVLQGAHQQLADGHSTLQKQLDDVTARHAEITGAHAQLQDEHSTMEREFEAMIAQHAEAKGVHEQIRDEHGALHGEFEQMVTQHAEVKGAYQKLRDENGTLQEEFEQMIAKHAEAQGEASSSRAELANTTNELETLRRDVNSTREAHDETSRQLETHRDEATGMQTRVESLEAQIAELLDDSRIAGVESQAREKDALAKHGDLSIQLATTTAARDAAEQKHAAVTSNIDALESEIVRLTTELTMAKADLDGAYGSRAERAKEAQAAELNGLQQRHQNVTAELDSLRNAHNSLQSSHEALKGEHETLLSQPRALPTPVSASNNNNERTKLLERELSDMATDFQDLTRESIELEKERSQLEDLIDGLRDRCEGLEAQLGDERVRWIGIKSPGAISDAGRNSMAMGGGAREMTSTAVLRQEFKKMMRETRAEGVRLLRVSAIRHSSMMMLMC